MTTWRVDCFGDTV